MRISQQKCMNVCDIAIRTMAEKKWDQEMLTIPLLADDLKSIRKQQSSDKSY